MKNTYLIAASLVALTLSSWSMAADAPHGNGPCKDDLTQFCQGIQPGGGRMAACLKAHKAQLSEACKQGLIERREHRKAGKAAGTTQAETQ